LRTVQHSATVLDVVAEELHLPLPVAISDNRKIATIIVNSEPVQHTVGSNTCLYSAPELA